MIATVFYSVKVHQSPTESSFPAEEIIFSPFTPKFFSFSSSHINSRLPIFLFFFYLPFPVSLKYYTYASDFLMAMLSPWTSSSSCSQSACLSRWFTWHSSISSTTCLASSSPSWFLPFSSSTFTIWLDVTFSRLDFLRNCSWTGCLS